MRTDDLIKMLAAGDATVDHTALARKRMLFFGGALLAAALFLHAYFGVRWEMANDAGDPMFWIKFAYVGVLAVASVAFALRIGRPGVTAGPAPWVILGTFVALWLIGAISLSVAPSPEAREALVFGQTWRSCAKNIAMLATPVFVGMLLIMRTLAPTELRLAGGAAGLAAGTVGAAVYSMHCPELGAPFLGIWYVLGMAIPTVIGALIGPRLLRW